MKTIRWPLKGKTTTAREHTLTIASAWEKSVKKAAELISKTDRNPTPQNKLRAWNFIRKQTD